jgi:hypothetical protein
MERDAPQPPPPTDPVPPAAWETVRKVGLAGIGLTAAAAALGGVANVVENPPWPLATARLFLVLTGAITAGFAVSLRPGLWRAWGLGAVAAAVAVPGTPASWDSFRLLFTVLALAAVTGAALVAAPRPWRQGVISALVVFHFGGIFMATTSPPPTPWLVEQLFQRVYNPYLQFMYLRNAYHFYSPEPGPASLLCFLLTTYELKDKVGADGRPVLDAKGRPVKETLADVMAMDPDARRKRVEKTEWVVLPRRPADVRDPLGLTYYRRLSLTEQTARVYPALMSSAEKVEKEDVIQRRRAVSNEYPLLPTEDPILQYRMPNRDIAQVLLPSYTSHVIMNYTPEDDALRLRTTVKMYRFEHRTLDVLAFTGVNPPLDGSADSAAPPRRPIDPYHPTTYRPYYLGEWDVFGTLLNPQEPMLYWLVPVLPNPAGLNGKDYDDVLSKQAGAEFDWRQLR